MEKAFLTDDIRSLVSTAKAKDYIFDQDDIVAITYALGAAGVTRLFNDKGRVAIPAIAALINYDQSDKAGRLDTAFETLVDLELTTWPDGYQIAQ